MPQNLSDEFHLIPVDIDKDCASDIVSLISTAKANMCSGSKPTHSANGRNHGIHAS